MGEKNKLLDYYRTMLLIRFFEEKVEDLFRRGAIKGTSHPATGQEACAVGACAALGKKDYVTSTHRGHGHMIARGGDPSKIMAELFGKESGYSRGRGGSQLMADFQLGFLGSNGITGGGLPLATGVALSAKLRHTRRVVACFFGDGASNQGTFHESLNMASLWKLPVIYICENNLYAMSTNIKNSMAVKNVAERAAAYAMEGVRVDGNDVLAVHDAVHMARVKAKKGDGPSLIECATYRLSGHSRGDPRKYRTAAEEKEWEAKEPIKHLRKLLLKKKYMTGKESTAIRKEARQIIAEAVKFSKRSKFPDESTLTEGLFA